MFVHASRWYTFAYINFNCTAILMQACNAHGLYCVPLYDTLGMLFSSLELSQPMSNAMKIDSLIVYF